jgi:hypothetical protein
VEPETDTVQPLAKEQLDFFWSENLRFAVSVDFQALTLLILMAYCHGVVSLSAR